MQTFIFAHTTEELPVLGYQWKPKAVAPKSPHVLLLGGVHGDEPEGVVLALGLLQHFLQHPPQFHLTVVPQFNLDGSLRLQRQNAQGVDLNRNLATQDWSPEIKGPRYQPGPRPLSESENQGLVQFLTDTPPSLIISLHSWHPVLNVNGDCEPEAQAIAKVCGYRVDTEIGYPTPGCLGTYAGLERAIPTLTYEIERGLSPSANLKLHLPAVLSGLKTHLQRKANP